MIKKYTVNAITGELDLIGNVPQLTTDPTSPNAEDLWMLRTGGGGGGGKPLGLLLALTTPNSGGTPTYTLSYRTKEGTTKRITGGSGGSGDVLGPSVNSDNRVPQWDGNNSKLLKNGLTVGTSALSLVQLDSSAKLPAVDGSQLLNVATGNVIAPITNTNNRVPRWNGANSKTLSDGLDVGTSATNLVQLDSSAKLPAVDGSALTNIGNTIAPAFNTDSKVPQWNGVISKTLKDGLTVGTSANNLVQLDAGAKLPAVDGSNLINLPSSGGGANAAGTYLVQTSTNAPVNAQSMGALTTGLVKNTSGTGVQQIAVAGTDYLAPSGDGSALTNISIIKNGNDNYCFNRLGTTRAFGDSITVGEGASSSSTTAYIPLIAARAGLSITNLAVSGKEIVNTARTSVYPISVGSYDQSIMLNGYNDMRDYGSSTLGQSTYEGALRACLVWLSIPQTEKIFAQNASFVYSGSWSNNSPYGSLASKMTSTNGATATITVYGTAIYLSYTVFPSFPSGTMSVSIDGVSQGSIDTSSGQVAATALDYWPAVVRYSGLSSGPHTVIITSTSAHNLYIDYIATNQNLLFPSSPRVYCGNTLRMSPTGYSTSAGYTNGSNAIVDQFNAINTRVCKDLASDGLWVAYINASNSYNPDNGSDLNADNIHPNDQGHSKIANCFLKAGDKFRYSPFVRGTTSAYAVSAYDDVILADSTSSTITITLPTSVGAIGKTYTIKDWKGTSGSNNITIGTTSSQTIDGVTTKTLNTNYQSITVISDNANWVMISKV